MGSFEILAEVAVGMAGFGVIALALLHDRDGWQSADLFRTSGLLLSSFGAVFLALLPIGLGETTMSGSAIWRLSSACMLAYMGVFSVVVTRMRLRHLQRDVWMGRTLSAAIFVSWAANAIAQTANLLGLFVTPNGASYFFGVVWFLLMATLMFARIVFIRPGSR